MSTIQDCHIVREMKLGFDVMVFRPFLLVKLGSGQHVTNRRQIDQFLPITPLCGIFAWV